jgi:hypothetical protein
MSEVAGNPDQLGHAASQGGRAETIRASLFQELLVNTMTQDRMADEKHFFVAGVGTNTLITGGTASHAAPTVTDGTKALFSIKNLDTTKVVYPVFYRHRLTVAGAGASSSRWYVEKSASGVSRFTSATATNVGSTGIVVASPGTGGLSNVDIRYGAVVAPADTAAILIGEGMSRGILPVVHDQWHLNFGVNNAPGSLDIAVATASYFTEVCAACPILPGETMLLHLVNAAQSGASSYGFRFGFYQR